MRNGVTIGQAAAFAGVTVKTVRHYHRLGLLDEPQRDRSGYRRYVSTDLLRLVQIRTLTGAGVPLAKIGDLLDAGPERFAAALADVERRLTAQIDELVARRARLDRLAQGDRVLLPDRACAIVDRLVDLGFAPAYVASQREALVLARAMVPEDFDGFMTLLERRLDDPEFVALLKRSWEAASWAPDDPRLEDLATAVADNLLAHHIPKTLPDGFRATPDAGARYGLINRHRANQLPTLTRLTTLVDARLRAAGIAMPYK
ncbi:regulatory protein, MerR [Minicystis rosea]|nr:regulatory protein, MerR [Minicystis rosea]